MDQLQFTVVTTSDERAPTGRTGYRDDLHRVVGEIVAALNDGFG